MAKWFLISLAIVLVASTRLIPAEYRLLNFTAMGALALFVAARVGLWQSILITSAAMLASDAVQLWQHNYDAMYLPFAATYGGLAIYAVLGRKLIGESENLVTIGSTAILASVLFFLVTNFASWVSPIHGYDRSMAGLLDCYTQALPFYRGTLFGDLFFSSALFSIYTYATQDRRVLSTVRLNAVVNPEHRP